MDGSYDQPERQPNTKLIAFHDTQGRGMLLISLLLRQILKLMVIMVRLEGRSVHVHR